MELPKEEWSRNGGDGNDRDADTWIHEDELWRLPGFERRLIEKELWRCLSSLDAGFPSKSPAAVRHLLKQALELEIESSAEQNQRSSNDTVLR